MSSPLLRSGALLALLVLCACEPSAKTAESEAQIQRPQIVLAKAGPVAALVKEAVAEAARDSRRLVVYVGASWCEPCKYFLAAVEADRLPERFDDLRLLKFDYDQDETRLEAAGFGGEMIPRFVIPGLEGRASDRAFEGSIKGPGATENLIPKLDWLLERAPDANEL